MPAPIAGLIGAIVRGAGTIAGAAVRGGAGVARTAGSAASTAARVGGGAAKGKNAFDTMLKTTGKLDKALKDPRAVEIGLPDDRIHNPSGLTLAKLGAIHEFGLGNVPERSFLRGWAQSNKPEIKEALTIVMEKIVKGEDPEAALSQLAQWGEGQVKEYIADGIDPPKKLVVDGKTTPLIDTGELRQGIIGVVVDDS